MRRCFILYYFLFFLNICSFSQDLEKLKVDKLYITSFDKVLDDISETFNLKFAYDREVLATFRVDERPIEKPLIMFLNQKCGEYKLKWYITPDSVIHIDSKYERLTSKPAETGEKRTYTGDPSKFDFTLTGLIRDKLTGEALPFANVGIRSTSIGTFTNNDGYFSLINVPADTSTLIVSYIGYYNATIYLTPEVPVVNLLIELEPRAQNLKEVVITGEQEELMNTNEKISAIKLTPQKLSALPNIGEMDIMRSFQLMPGISIANESSSNLYVRGGTPDQNLILYDGFTIYQVDHLYGFYSAFNPNAVKDVQLYKGGFESKFGGRLSSVTEITGKDGSSKGFNLGGDISLLCFNLFAEIPIGSRFTSLLAFRRSYQGLLYDKIFNQFNNSNQQIAFRGDSKRPGGGPSLTSTVSSYFYDLNAKFTYRPSAKDIISLSFYNGTDKLDNGMNVDATGGGPGGFNFSMDNSDLTAYGNLGIGLKWTRNWNAKLFGNALISYSNYYSKRDRSSSGTRFGDDGGANNFNSGLQENNDLKDFSFKSDNSYFLNTVHQFGFGIFLTNYQIAYDFGETDTAKVLNKNNYGFLGGGYFQDKIKFLDSKMVITPGLRISYYSPTGKPYFEPRVSLSYEFIKSFKVVFETGKFYQFANRVVREDILSGSRDFWILSDGSNIPVSAAWHFITGISYETKTILASIEGYYKLLDGVTEYSMRFSPNQNGSTYAENFFTGSGYATGLEFLLQKKFGKLTGWISYTLGEAKNKIEIYGDDYYPAAQDVRHELKIIGMYEYRNLTFSATWLFASGRPYTAPDGAYVIQLLNGNEQTYIDFSAKNASRLPAYHRLDVAVNYHFRKRESGHEWGNIGLSVFNVYNHKNIWYKEYQIIGDQIIETDKQFLGISPNLTLTLKLK